MRSFLLLFALLTTAPAAPPLREQSFDRDPGWEGHNNRVVPEKTQKVTQDFGYSATGFAAHAAGELGGIIQRCTTPASYAAAIPPMTLDEKLSASGTFAVTKCGSGAGLTFGFFNSAQPGGSGRPIGSLGLDMGFESKGGRLAVRLITGQNQSCGTFITPFIPGKFRPTPIRADGTRYHWTLDYDPQGAQGNGRFTYHMTSETHLKEDYGELNADFAKEAQARFPNTTTFTVDLPAGYKQQHTTFDRFGLENTMKSGGTATVFFGDLQVNGKAQDFTKDPGWIGAGNRITFDDGEVTGAHNFGFSPDTSHAGGQRGEVGGGLWRSGRFAYYADRVGPLNLDQRLEARGRVKLVTAGPDSDCILGWFNSAAQENEPAENYLGIHIGGPTRVGHYFIPVFATAKGTKGKVEQGPILTPGQAFEWSIIYDPAGLGSVTVTLGEKTVTLPLKPGQKAQGAAFDRFGLFTSTAGGQMVKVYLDDLAYTAEQ